MIVKICGITTVEDALAAVAVGATALGFNFYLGSPRYIRPEAACRIVQELPPSVLTVGVFVDETREMLERIVSDCGLHIAQLHGNEDPKELLEYKARLWKAFRVTPNWDPFSIEYYCTEAYVLDGPAGALFGGAGEAFDWRIVRDIRRPLIIAGGLDATNVAEVVRELRPCGVDACSRLELSPGRKDRIRMRDFVRAALAAEADAGKDILQ